MRIAIAACHQFRNHCHGRQGSNRLARSSSLFQRQRQQPAQSRSITVGTDMLSSVISLEPARPWSMTDSNKTQDHQVTLKDLLANQRVVLFGVPAPFTGTCTLEHYPTYQKLAPELLEKHGVDKIICYSVADPYAHHGWSQALGNNDELIEFWADPDATFARAYGVAAVYDEVSLGQRSQRFSMVIDQGQVVLFRTVTDNAKEDAKMILEGIQELNENQESIA